MKHFPHYDVVVWNEFDEQVLHIADEWVPHGFVPPMRCHLAHGAMTRAHR